MTQCELPKEELVRRKELSDNTRKMIYSLLDVAAEDETSLMTTYRDFYLQISFSELHPLMVFYLARPLDGEKAMLADRSSDLSAWLSLPPGAEPGKKPSADAAPKS